MFLTVGLHQNPEWQYTPPRPKHEKLDVQSCLEEAGIREPQLGARPGQGRGLLRMRNAELGSDVGPGKGCSCPGLCVSE